MKSLSRKPAGAIDFAEHDFGIAIDRGGIDQTSAAGDQRLQDGRRFLPGGVVVVVEDVGGAKPDGRQLFAAARDRARDQRRGVLRDGRNGEHRGARRRAPRIASGGCMHVRVMRRSLSWSSLRRRRHVRSWPRCR